MQSHTDMEASQLLDSAVSRRVGQLAGRSQHTGVVIAKRS